MWNYIIHILLYPSPNADLAYNNCDWLISSHLCLPQQHATAISPSYQVFFFHRDPHDVMSTSFTQVPFVVQNRLRALSLLIFWPAKEPLFGCRVGLIALNNSINLSSKDYLSVFKQAPMCGTKAATVFPPLVISLCHMAATVTQCWPQMIITPTTTYWSLLMEASKLVHLKVIQRQVILPFRSLITVLLTVWMVFCKTYKIFHHLIFEISFVFHITSLRKWLDNRAKNHALLKVIQVL